MSCRSYGRYLKMLFQIFWQFLLVATHTVQTTPALRVTYCCKYWLGHFENASTKHCRTKLSSFRSVVTSRGVFWGNCCIPPVDAFPKCVAYDPGMVWKCRLCGLYGTMGHKTKVVNIAVHHFLFANLFRQALPVLQLLLLAVVLV